MSEFNKYYVDGTKRWVMMDRFGNKDTLTIKTKSGQLVTRTCQYWSMFFIPHLRTTTPKAKISYKGRYYFVTTSTVLED